MNRSISMVRCAVVLLVLCACQDPQSHLSDYQIVISGSVSSNPVEFAGSYTFMDQGQELTRDLSGAGSFSMTLQSTYLKRVRVQRELGTGLVSLTVYENGVVLFESVPTDTPIPIVFTNQKPVRHGRAANAN